MKFPKNPRQENLAFRELARGEDCTMMVPGVCSYNPETVVLAHSNSLADGKGMGYKSSDAEGVWACYACHSWLDQGKASREEKDRAFHRAQLRMIQRLQDIVTSPTSKPDKAEAALWALRKMSENSVTP